MRATKFWMSQNAFSWCRCTSHIAGDVTPPPRFSGDPYAKKIFDVRFGMYSSIAFERAIARLYASNKILNVTNFFSWCRCTSHIAGDVTSPPRLSGDPHTKKFFWGQIWNVLSSSFRTRHRSSLYVEYPLGSHKTLFTWGPPFPMSPLSVIDKFNQILV